jgi:aminoglycoside phosphotransferase family enzyme/predicted kinase
MIAEDQSETIAYLRAPGTLGATAPEVMETHISLIFLSGDRAWKLKRAVLYPYADFSTPALRRDACEKEVALNSRTAPEIYLGVTRITREPDGRLAIDGAGKTVDHLVAMRRFAQEALFDRMALDGRLTPALMTALAGEIAAFHAEAPVVRDETGQENMAAVLAINEAGFADSGLFPAAQQARLAALFRTALARHAPLLDRRARAGSIRRCHGDLHLRNVCLIDGRPRLFDCIEFNDRIATVDVLYDLAFLLMDLWHRELGGLANLTMNRYLDLTGDEDGMPALPFFMAVRAAVRAHVTASRAAAADAAEDRAALSAEAQDYARLAEELLRPGAAALAAIGGWSGTGKSTLAEVLAPRMAPPPGARVIESDRTRKALLGVTPLTRLDPEAYAPDVSERVYAELVRRAGALLAAGVPVVVDAVYDDPARRDALEAAALRAGADFSGTWLEADPALLRRRVAARRGGPSDATVEVLDRQLARDPGPIAWARRDAARAAQALAAEVLDDLDRARPHQPDGRD